MALPRAEAYSGKEPSQKARKTHACKEEDRASIQISSLTLREEGRLADRDVAHPSMTGE